MQLKNERWIGYYDNGKVEYVVDEISNRKWIWNGLFMHFSRRGHIINQMSWTLGLVHGTTIDFAYSY